MYSVASRPASSVRLCLSLIDLPGTAEATNRVAVLLIPHLLAIWVAVRSCMRIRLMAASLVHFIPSWRRGPRQRLRRACKHQDIDHAAGIERETSTERKAKPFIRANVGAPHQILGEWNIKSRVPLGEPDQSDTATSRFSSALQIQRLRCTSARTLSAEKVYVLPSTTKMRWRADL